MRSDEACKANMVIKILFKFIFWFSWRVKIGLFAADRQGNLHCLRVKDVVKRDLLLLVNLFIGHLFFYPPWVWNSPARAGAAGYLGLYHIPEGFLKK